MEKGDFKYFKKVLKQFNRGGIKNGKEEKKEKTSLKKKVYDELDQNSLLTPKKLCKILSLEYEQYKGYVTFIRHKWKYDIRNELRSKCPKSHKARAECRAVKSMSRDDALLVGWVQSKNRNRCFVFSDKGYGRIEWWETGNILVSIRRPPTMVRVKKFLCKAFFDSGLILNPKVLDAFLGGVHWKGAHDVYQTSQRLPYTVIDRYVKTHGMRIVLGDVTHRDGVEVQWVYPDHLERLELLQQQNINALETFSGFLKALSAPKRPGVPEEPSYRV